MNSPTLPIVSCVVPCRNERERIETCVRSLLAQEMAGGGIEVIVADGMSDDGTREILTRLISEDARLRLVDNGCRITPCAMNAGIRKAKGAYIAIMGAHCEYAPDYLRSCLEILEQHPEVCCSGGPILSRGRGLFGQAVAAAMSHPLGVGNAKHRFPNYEGYAEGACFPLFRREVFDKIGLYDEDLPRNQDDEFNYRIALSGGKIFISPRARCAYYVRETPAQVFRQYFQYGFWRVAVLRKHHIPASLRQLVPIFFFLSMLVLGVVGAFLPGGFRLTMAGLPVIYASVLLIAGGFVAFRHGVLVGLMFPLAAGVMHLAYATGFAWNLIKKNDKQLTNHFCQGESCHEF